MQRRAERTLATVALALAVATTSCATSPTRSHAVAPTPDLVAVRREIEQWYDENRRAFLAKDLSAIMALRAEDFHTVTPDGARQDRATMEQRTEGFLNGVDRWIEMTFEIDSLQTSGDLAAAVVRQHLDRMVLWRDGRVRHMETWATQRETWRRTPRGWKLYRVDSVRDQRRLLDGQPD